jgi:hypothetical protein
MPEPSLQAAGAWVEAAAATNIIIGKSRAGAKLKSAPAQECRGRDLRERDCF